MLTASQGILEDLLKTQKLENGEVDGGVETQTALVWPQGGIELHAISPVDLDLVLVVLPNDTELNDSFRDGCDLEGGLVLGVLFKQ